MKISTQSSYIVDTDRLEQEIAVLKRVLNEKEFELASAYTQIRLTGE